MAEQEVHRIEHRESFVKLESPVKVLLEDGSSFIIEIFKLLQVVRILNADNSFVALIHHEIHPEINVTSDQIKARLDANIAEKQEELEKLIAMKGRVDVAAVAEISEHIKEQTPTKG